MRINKNVVIPRERSDSRDLRTEIQNAVFAPKAQLKFQGLPLPRSFDSAGASLRMTGFPVIPSAEL